MNLRGAYRRPDLVSIDPFYLDRCDRHYANQRWLGHDFGGKLPSDIFREHSLACYMKQRFEVAHT
ncbi:MAG: amidohydrolase 2 [Actinomycetia bacterium]|nr:amidohydrolase 2 [Actinomycetes bacterium]